MKKKSLKSNSGKIVAAGIGIAAASIAAYLLLGPNGKKNRKEIKSWMVKMKAEVAEKIEDMQDVTADAYQDVVESVASKYSKLKNISAEDLKSEIAHLKSQWSSMKKTGTAGIKSAKKAVKKSITKASRKSTK